MLKELCKSLGLGIFAIFVIVTVCSAIFGFGILATNFFNVLF
jgi:hypothetical protein